MPPILSPGKKSAAHPPRMGNVQRHFVDLRAIHDRVLCLATSTTGVYDYVSVLQVEGISYDLKSEDEQHMLNDLYQTCLSALSFPIQILWRALPLNLAHYLAPFSLERHHPVISPAMAVPDEAQQTGQAVWEQLAASHVAFVQHVAAQRTLLERTIYLIVRVGSLPNEHKSLLQQMFFHNRKQVQAEAFDRAYQLLDMRLHELSRLLSNMNLSVRRLTDIGELASFYYSCLTPIKAARFPLPEAMIARLDHPIQASKPPDQRLAPALSWEHLLAHAAIEEDSQRSLSSKKALKKRRQELISSSSLFAHIADLVAPAAITLAPHLLQLEQEYCRTIIVRNLPRVVSAGWLKPLADLDEPLEVSFHLAPRNSAFMVQQFRRRQMEHQTSRMLAQRQGTNVDPELKVASADVDHLIERLASGEERMLDLSMHLLIRGSSIQELDQRTERIMSILHNMLLVAHSAFFEQDKAFRSCLPHAKNLLGEGILLDSRSASTMFPFLSQTLFHADGIFEGITPSGDLVVLDPWSAGMANANRIILGPPGWGKSHQVKASMIRMALKYTLKQHNQLSALPFQIIVIDPEREYGRTAAALQGHIFRLAPGSRHHINPFDLPRSYTDEEEQMYTSSHGDLLADHVQKLHTLLEIMLADRTPEGTGKLTSQEKGLLDRALYETYRKVGITSERRTHYHPAPLMRDLYEVLERGLCGPDPTGLTPRLRRYVHGSLAGLFTGPTDVALDNVVVVFDIHDMETELRPIGLFLVSNFVWTRSFQSIIPRQLIVDEAATLYHYESGAIFLEDLVRRARKHYLGVTVISQHPIIFQQSALPANCATHILMRQDATSLDLIERMFKLSAREIQLLRRLGVGEALLLTGDTRLHVRFETSELEHLLATTDPRELAQWRDDPAYQHVRPFLQTLNPSLLQHTQADLPDPTIKTPRSSAEQSSEENTWNGSLSSSRKEEQ